MDCDVCNSRYNAPHRAEQVHEIRPKLFLAYAIIARTSLDYLEPRYLGAQAMSGFLYFSEETGFLTQARRV